MVGSTTLQIMGRWVPQVACDCRTGFATPSEAFTVSHRQTLRTGLQTPSGEQIMDGGWRAELTHTLKMET